MSDPQELAPYVAAIGSAVWNYFDPNFGGDRREQLVAILEGAAGLERLQGDPADMVEFFESVADGVVAAQGRLDALTNGYLREREHLGHTHVVPSAYRIDRAQARLSFEFSEISKERVGLLFRRRETSLEEKTGHSVTFEVRAVPPPPEVRAELAGRPLTFAFEDDPALKQRILIAVAQAMARERAVIAAGGDDAAAAAVRLAKLELWEKRTQVVVRTPGGHVLLAVDDPADPVKLCVIGVDSDGDRIRLVVRDEPKTEDAPRVLRQSFFAPLLSAFVPPATREERPDEAVEAIGEAHQALDAVLWNDPNGRRPRRIRELLEAVEALERILGPAGTDVSEFFDGVARAVVQAQRGLDRRSRTYLDGNPFIPTTYRIPKVSAELSFAVQSVRRRRVNAILYGKEHRDAREREQRVELDILAAPLDPAQASDFHEARQQTFIVVLTAERERVRQAIAAATHDNAKARNRAGHLTDAATFAKAMVLRDGRRYVVMAPAPDRSGAVIAAELRDGLDPGGVHVGQTASDVPSSYGWFFEWWWPDYPRRDS